MATDTERQRLRMDLGFQPNDIASLPDAIIDDMFDEAAQFYSDPASIAVSVRVTALRRLTMQAANEVDYTKNNTSEKASQRYDHLVKELARWEDLLEYAIALSGESGSVRSGRPTSLPPYVREFPYGIFASDDRLI